MYFALLVNLILSRSPLLGKFISLGDRLTAPTSYNAAIHEIWQILLLYSNLTLCAEDFISSFFFVY